MQITRTSKISGKVHAREIPVAHAQIAAWQTGMLPIQHALRHLSDEDREFIMTGITPDEWDAAFGSEED